MWQESLIKFWSWCDEHFPADASQLVPQITERNCPISVCESIVYCLKALLTQNMSGYPLGRSYAEPGALDCPGAVQLRPWMINFSPELGLRGHIEPDT